MRWLVIYAVRIFFCKLIPFPENKINHLLIFNQWFKYFRNLNSGKTHLILENILSNNIWIIFKNINSKNVKY